MQGLHRRAVEEYRKELSQVLLENDRCMRFSKKPEAFDVFRPKATKIVIPRTEANVRGGFFLFTRTSIRTEDDPILRFIPHLPKTTGHVNLIDFKGTELTEKPYGLDEEIMGRMVRIIATEKDRLKLLGLAVDEGAKESKVVETISDFLGMEYETVLSRYRMYGVKSCAEETMKSLFCNVCFIFDCKWHKRTEGICIKPIGFEKDPKNAYLRTRDVCSKTCKKMEGMSIEGRTEISSLQPTLRSELSRIYDQSQGFACIASLVFYFRHKKYIPCADIRGIFNIPPRQLKFVASNIPKTKVNPDRFFTPCDHQGYCNQQNGCSCIRNKTNCEVSCLCMGCRNFFMGCSCSTRCHGRCPCKLARRECTSVCSCKGCRNKQLQSENEAQTFVAPSKIAGYGLFAGEKITKGRFVIEYLGEIISNEEAERRGSFYDLKGCSYLFDLCTKDGAPVYTIDAGLMGNGSRFINHSRTNANLNAIVSIVNGVRRIGFYAAREVNKYEELFFDYNYSEQHKIKHIIVD